MSQRDTAPQDSPSYSSLEQSFKQVVSPIEEFLHQETSSGILLMICVAVALVIANSPLFPVYDAVLHTKFTIGTEKYYISQSIQHWINDGLMALFFFVIGLEVKREFLIGELSNLRQAILPISAAIGGMVVPAGFYLIFNSSGPEVNGWGIPMATDIAFAVGIVALLGSRVPKPLVAMLLALAIVDDIGAILVIALFYTDTIHMGALIFSGVCFLLLIAVNLVGVRSPLPYGVIGLIFWLAMLKSGIHATLVGVLTAFTVPARSSLNSHHFSAAMTDLLKNFRSQIQETGDSQMLGVLRNSRKQALLQSMENGLHKMESPLQRMEHVLHGWVSFTIVPLFALANAGIPIDFDRLGEILLHPVTIGVMAGLLLGKVVGIYSFSWLVVKLKLGDLPQGVTMSQILGIGLLAGIGFTMSIFIGSLAFESNPEALLNAKIGILFASLAAGILGYIWLYKTTSK
ncbi:MAG: Na+/H+ antiporter NhaA [Desulfocapsaceae bacterium]